MSVGQQFRQLPMFMSAREIKSQYDPWHGDREEVETNDVFRADRTRPETDSELWDRKYQEATLGKEPTLDKQVLREGVKRPVALEVVDPWWHGDKKPEIMGGHHRIEIMARHKPDALMPVEHVSDFKDARRSQATHDQAEISEQARGRR